MNDPAQGYREDPSLPGYWFYREYRIQADVEAHRFTTQLAGKVLPQGARALDIAAGEGALTQQLLDIGLDVSATSWNERSRPSIPTYRIDLDQSFTLSEVGGEPYDLVCCIEVIEHLESPARFLRDCRPLLSEAGRLVLSTPNVESAPSRLQWLVYGCPRMFAGPEITDNRHIAMMWRQGLEHLIQLAGFEIEQKVLLGDLRLNRGLRSFAKRAVYGLMQRLLLGELRGNTRLYVLRHGGRLPGRQGPGDVY